MIFVYYYNGMAAPTDEKQQLPYCIGQKRRTVEIIGKSNESIMNTKNMF